MRGGGRWAESYDRKKAWSLKYKSLSLAMCYPCYSTDYSVLTEELSALPAISSTDYYLLLILLFLIFWWRNVSWPKQDGSAKKFQKKAHPHSPIPSVWCYSDPFYFLMGHYNLSFVSIILSRDAGKNQNENVYKTGGFLKMFSGLVSVFFSFSSHFLFKRYVYS